jgi:hypothetical protein
LVGVPGFAAFAELVEDGERNFAFVVPGVECVNQRSLGVASRVAHLLTFWVRSVLRLWVQVREVGTCGRVSI